MAAGLSQKQITARIYRRLLSIARDLRRAGVHTQYQKATAQRYAKLVFFEGDGVLVPHSNVDGGFNISYSVSRASNGETFGSATIYLVYKGESTNYGLASVNGSFEQGIARIKELFAAPKEVSQ